jgi:hypothetical protein
MLKFLKNDGGEDVITTEEVLVVGFGGGKFCSRREVLHQERRFR